MRITFESDYFFKLEPLCGYIIGKKGSSKRWRMQGKTETLEYLVEKRKIYKDPSESFSNRYMALERFENKIVGLLEVLEEFSERADKQ